MITYYYPRTLKGISVALLNMFNDMKVVKYAKDGSTVSERKVPIAWGPIEKYHQDRKENHYVDADGNQHNLKYYQQIPRMALVLNGIVYDSDRAAGTNQWRYWFTEQLNLTESEIDSTFTDYQPTPYNYNFTLYIRADSTDYLAQILENILPYFNPKLMLRVKEFSFLNIERDLPVKMEGVDPDFPDEMNESDTKYANAQINLTVEGWQYRPVLYSSVIKVINTKYLLLDTATYLEGFSLSGVQTSGGVPIETSGIPLSADYDFSGSYEDTSKEYDWFETYQETSGFGL
tara:strand:- start:13396 stop:14262 length:867 start_codon:yes stop_codon:yes gene_type:complete